MTPKSVLTRTGRTQGSTQPGGGEWRKDPCPLGNQHDSLLKMTSPCRRWMALPRDVAGNTRARPRLSESPGGPLGWGRGPTSEPPRWQFQTHREVKVFLGGWGREGHPEPSKGGSGGWNKGRGAGEHLDMGRVSLGKTAPPG